MLPFAVLLCALLWGSAFPGIKGIYTSWAENGIETTFSNRLLIAGIRFTFAGLLLLAIAKQPIQDFLKTPKLNLLYFTLGQTYLQYIFFYTGLALGSAVLGSLLASSGTFWWLLLAPLLLKSPWPNKWQWLLFIVGAAGVTLAVYQPGTGNKNLTLGVLCFLTSTLCGAFGIITYQKVVKTMGARAVTGYGLFIGGLMLMLSGVAAWKDITTLFTSQVIWLTLYLSMVSAVGFGIWNYLTQLFPVNLLAGYRFLIPVCAVIESTLFVKGESPGYGIWIGGSIVIASIIGLQALKRKQEA